MFRPDGAGDCQAHLRYVGLGLQNQLPSVCKDQGLPCPVVVRKEFLDEVRKDDCFPRTDWKRRRQPSFSICKRRQALLDAFSLIVSQRRWSRHPPCLSRSRTCLHASPCRCTCLTGHHRWQSVSGRVAQLKENSHWSCYSRWEQTSWAARDHPPDGRTYTTAKRREHGSTSRRLRTITLDPRRGPRLWIWSV